MSSDSNSSEEKSKSHPSGASPSISNSEGATLFNAIGNDNKQVIIEGGVHHYYSGVIEKVSDLIQLVPVVGAKFRFFHYIFVVLLLLFYLVVWTILGIGARTAFPTNHVTTLLTGCIFKSPDKLRQELSQDIRRLKNESLEKRDTEAPEEAHKRLRHEKSRLVLNKQVLELLYRVTNSPSVIENIELIEKKIDLDLEPLREEYDSPVTKALHRTQKAIDVLLGEKNAAEKDIEMVQTTLNNLISRYKIDSKLPSEEILGSLISDLDNYIGVNPYAIRKSSLKTLKNVRHLLQWSSLIYGRSEDSINFYTEDEPPTEFSTELSTSLESDTQDKYSIELETGIDGQPEISPFSDERAEQNHIETLRVASLTEFLCSQMELLLKKATNESEETIERLKLGVRKRWISEIHVYGFKDYKPSDASNIAAIKIFLSIDQEYKNKEIVIDQQKLENLEEEIDQFNLLIEKHDNLTAKWQVTYTQPVREDHELYEYVRKQLNLTAANPVTWTYFTWLLNISALRRLIRLPGFSVGIEFGPNNQRSHVASDDIDPSEYWISVVVISIVVVMVFLLFTNFQPNLDSPNEPRFISPSEEQTYLSNLHITVDVWDLESTIDNLNNLAKSQNPCVVQFSTEFKENLILKGEEGFRDINSIRRSINEQGNCNLEIVPYEFAP